MWTPKRVLMLAFGLVLFCASYFVYARFLGGIDGLPPLPEALRVPRRADDQNNALHPTIHPLDDKLCQAFGPACAELHRPYRLEFNKKSTILASDSCNTEDGKLVLQNVSIALFGKDIKPYVLPRDMVEINTLRCRKAVLTFDRPLEKSIDAKGRKIVGAELTGNIVVVNNRGTIKQTDDLSVFIDNGPLYYDDATHKIWTHDRVHLVDNKSQPKPTEVRGKGMEMDLAVETPAPPPGAVANYKPRGETITGVKRIVLQSEVEMQLYVDAHSGFPASQPAGPTGPAAPTVPAAPPEKAHVTIKSPGRFQYDLLKDYDLAHFDVDPGKGAALLQSNSPQDVIVTRHNETLNLVDQLVCKHLDLKLKRKEAVPVAGKGPAPAANDSADRGLEIETTHATGPNVTITSDAEKLMAQCVDLYYDAKTKLTILKGDPEIYAVKEDNTLHARELRLQEQPAPTPNGKPFQQATAIGPGRIDLVEKEGPADKKPAKPGDKKPLMAFWDDTLVSTKDGPYDLLILTQNARFIDEEHGQTLNGDTLKVWMGNDDKPTGKVSSPAQSDGQQARKPHHLEAHGNVSATSSEMKVHHTSRLVVWFRDDETPRVLPLPVAGPGELSPAVPPPVGPGGTPPLNHQAGKPAAPAAKKEDDVPPRPIDLSARSVEARVLRGETKNTLESVRCDGNVQVKQDPAKPGDKGVDITGTRLAMDYHPDGNTLVVTGDGQETGSEMHEDVAVLQMDKIIIFGNEVHIDQAANKAWVVGPGVMVMESETSFSGEKLQKPVPLTVHWDQSMLFNGDYAEFHGNVQGEQENARLACEVLVVVFDRKVSLKEGNKSDQPARVQHMMCDRAVRIEDSTYEGKERIKFEQIVAPELRMDTLFRDSDDPLKPAKVNEGNEMRVVGPGEVRNQQKGGIDPTAPPGAPPPGSGAKPVATKTKPAPAAKPDDDVMKMTYVNFRTSMYANSKTNYAKFIGNVRVLNFACADPHVEINVELMLAQMPDGALYVSSDVLEVWSHQAKDRKYSEMVATGRALVQSNEFWGRAAVIRFDEAKDQVIFDGGDGKATLVKVAVKGKEPETIVGKKIYYVRSTGQIWVDRADSLQGIGASGPPR